MVHCITVHTKYNKLLCIAIAALWLDCISQLSKAMQICRALHRISKYNRIYFHTYGNRIYLTESMQSIYITLCL